MRELVLKSQVVIFGDFDSEQLSKRLVVAADQTNVILSGSKLDKAKLRRLDDVPDSHLINIL